MNVVIIILAVLIGGSIFALLRAGYAMHLEARAWREWNNLADLLEQYPDEIDFIDEEVGKFKSSKEIRSELEERANRK